MGPIRGDTALGRVRSLPLPISLFYLDAGGCCGRCVLLARGLTRAIRRSPLQIEDTTCRIVSLPIRSHPDFARARGAKEDNTTSDEVCLPFDPGKPTATASSSSRLRRPGSRRRCASRSPLIVTCSCSSSRWSRCSWACRICGSRDGCNCHIHRCSSCQIPSVILTGAQLIVSS
jgi:hypothetical protein